MFSTPQFERVLSFLCFTESMQNLDIFPCDVLPTGYLFLFLNLLVYCCIVAECRNKSSGLGNISAAVLLPFFVYSLNLGLNGAALATIASQYVLQLILFRELH